MSDNNPIQATHVAILFKEAFSAHQRGDLATAEAGYRRLLDAAPDHADALHLLGVVAIQRGDYSAAIEAIRQAVRLNPANSLYHNNLGIAFQSLGQWQNAAQTFAEAAIIEPRDLNAHFNLGNALHALGRYAEAIASFDRALTLQQSPAIWSNRGLALAEANQRDEAIASYDRAISLQANYADGHYNRANVLVTTGRLSESLVSFDRAVSAEPGHVQAWSNRGNVLQQLKQREAAIASYDRALALAPEREQDWSNRGNVLHDLGRYDEALANMDRALSLAPDFADAWSNRTAILKDLHRYDEAIESALKALSIRPEYTEAFFNLGNVCKACNRLDQAASAYEQALALRNDYVQATWNLALVRLLQADFARGWALHESRWDNPETGLKRRNLPKPLWLGETSLAGRTILIHAEQGLGDTLQFCRYVPLLAERGARVILEVPPALQPLMQTLQGVTRVVTSTPDPATFDCHCPLLSLPYALRHEVTELPAPLGYLHDTEARRRQWSDRLGPRRRPRVGLVWSGNPAHNNDKNRSLPLSYLMSQLPVDIDYVSLQKEVRSSDQAALQANGVWHAGNELRDFSDTAALCSLMDSVVSVDTSVAHLAAALGRPTSILLPHVPDWRWQLERSDSPWYPTVRLYRQSMSRNWEEPLTKLRADLGDFCS